MASTEHDANQDITYVFLDDSDARYGFFPGAHAEDSGDWSGYLTDGDDRVSIIGSPAELRALAAAATRAAEMGEQHIASGIETGYWGGQTPPPEARRDREGI